MIKDEFLERKILINGLTRLFLVDANGRPILSLNEVNLLNISHIIKFGEFYASLI
jgi:hypothetical protein